MPNHKIKIVHIVQSLSYGGMEGRILRLARGLDPQRFSISLISFRDPNVGAFALPPGVEHTYFPIAPGWHFGRLLSLARLIRRKRYDVVHTHNWATMFYGVMAAVLALRPRILHGEHGLNVEDLGKRNLKRAIAQRALASLAHLIIPVNAVIAENIKENWHLRPSQYRVVPNGVDLARFRPAAAPPPALVVGAVARMEPIKDLPCLLRAASLLDREPRVPFRLVLVGDGPLRKNLESLARELRIDDRTEFTGEVEDVHLKYPSFTLLVNCSVYEGMSNTILEGMACGLPILASRVPGNQLWLKDGENALFFASGDAEGLAAAIRKVWGDRELALNLGRNNRERVEREFANGKFIEAYLDVYRAILGKRFPEAGSGRPTA